MAIQSVYRILKNFKMPGFTVPEFRRKAVTIAMGGSTTRGSTSKTW